MQPYHVSQRNPLVIGEWLCLLYIYIVVVFTFFLAGSSAKLDSLFN
jgi:hypothetical protein